MEHALRHSLASNLLSNNTPMHVIKDVLGHTNLNTTRIYLNIDFNTLKHLVASKDKIIMMIGSNDCQYCERLKPIIGKIGIQNNITIYYFKPADEELGSVEEYLTSLGYKEVKLSTPLIMITENSQLLDYIIGLSDKSLYEEKFVEFGVIR